FLVLTILVIGGYVLTGVQWVGLAESQDFNLSVYGVTWTVIPTVLSVLGIVLILAYFRWITDAPLKLVFFVILLMGFGGTLFQLTRGTLIGDYAGPSRLAFLAALPILPAIIYRMVIGHLQSEIAYP